MRSLYEAEQKNVSTEHDIENLDLAKVGGLGRPILKGVCQRVEAELVSDTIALGAIQRPSGQGRLIEADIPDVAQLDSSRLAIHISQADDWKKPD